MSDGDGMESVRSSRRPTVRGCVLALTLAATTIIAGSVRSGATSAGLPIQAADDGDIVVDENPGAAETSSTSPVAEVDALVDADPDPAAPADLGGDAAVAVLVDNGLVDVVADNSSIEPQQLIDELTEDPTAFVSTTGLLGYIDVGGGPFADSLDIGDLPGGPLPADVFDLDSNPTSTKTIYLDFNGHNTRDDYWNRDIDSAPFDNDNDPSTFSTSERAQIYEIWQRVSEDFVPFDINVSTREPVPGALARTSASDRSYGQRVVVSPTNWTGMANTRGIAYLGVFDAPIDNVAFAFTDATSNRPAAVAETISHETGHTLGLRHDATVGAPYYSGHGNWAPLMGNPLDSSPQGSKLVTQWSKGEYPGADNQEDDIAEIVACAGARPDDRPNVSGSGATIPLDAPAVGVIGAFGDIDVFEVEVGSGPVSVVVRSLAAWSNLRAQVVVRDAAGAVVAVAYPVGSTTWSTRADTASVPAGHYSIELTPVGSGTASTGFTSYGSMGLYEITVDATASPTPPTMQQQGSAYATASRISLPPAC